MDITPIETKELKNERAQFKALILGNPNYFGNLKESPYKPIKTIISNTFYEEIKCVGFNPQLNQLEAVVLIKRDSGYGGDICTSGSTEYVRFCISFDNGATWQDQGVASFKAYDIPGDKPLEYAVTLNINPEKMFCFTENLPKVRAILSWNFQPNDCSSTPVWGNVVEERIQIDPLKFIILKKFFVEAKLKIPANIEALLDETKQIETAKPKILSAADLHKLYQDKDVPEHRFLFEKLQKQMVNPGFTPSQIVPNFKGIVSGLDIDLAGIINTILQTDGDTSYEELGCVGLDPNLDSLVGVLRIKRPYGYSGGLCTAGSQEYVAFWVDWGDGIWDWVGTAQVNVHDISSIPPGGLEYAVGQPVNLADRRKPCKEGARIARVRAILSWGVPPPPANPDFVPTWGNREETIVHIYPGVPVEIGDYTPYLESICGVGVCNIDQTTGFAPGTLPFSDRPFGGSIGIYGDIPGAPDINTLPGDRPKYRISVHQWPAGSWQHLTDSFGCMLDEKIGPNPATSTPITQSVDVDDYFTFQNALSSTAGWRHVIPFGLLAVWNTAGKTGLWEIMIEAIDPVSSAYFSAGILNCVSDGSTRQSVIVDLDQAAPVTDIIITEFSRDGGHTRKPAGNCGTFQVGDIIYGTYTVSDEHFGLLTMRVEPSGPANGATVNPPSRQYGSPDFVPTTGETGTWSLDTSNMDPCGYTVQLKAWDRTIANCCCAWENDNAFVGFCLKASE